MQIYTFSAMLIFQYFNLKFRQGFALFLSRKFIFKFIIRNFLSPFSTSKRELTYETMKVYICIFNF